MRPLSNFVVSMRAMSPSPLEAKLALAGSVFQKPVLSIFCVKFNAEFTHLQMNFSILSATCSTVEFHISLRRMWKELSNKVSIKRS